MKQLRFFCATMMVLVCAALLGVPGKVSANPEPIHTLFIGNSYTAFNDTPDTVSQMGSSLGYDIRVNIRTIGGASLSDHRRNRETLQMIDSRRWDVAVLQDHSLAPSMSPDYVRRHRLPDLRALVRLVRIKSPDVRIVLYQTWGRRVGDSMTCMAYPASCNFTRHTAALARGYRLYQKAVSGTIAPVGENWQRVSRDKSGTRPFPAKALWLNDNSHPSRLGSYLAAATILRAITGAKVGDADYAAGLPPDATRYLREMADKP